MSDNLIKTGRIVTVFGGSGFVGRHVVRALAKDGWRIRVATRRPDLAFHLQPIGRVGQIHAVQANVRFPASVAAAIAGADAVVNLVGVRMERGKQTFDSTHVEGARAIAEATRAAGITNLTLVSGIGVDPESDSAFVRSKAAGEAATRQAVPTAIIVRPSVVFGPEDVFFNRFGALARIQLTLPLFGGGEAKMQPVFVGDVAKAVAKAVNGEAKPGTTYELGGPRVATFRELMQFVCETTGRKRLLVPLPTPIGNIVASVTDALNRFSLGLFPEWLVITRDQLKLLTADNVVSEAAIAEGRTLQGLGIAPESFETIAPTYLGRFRKAGQFEAPKAA